MIDRKTSCMMCGLLSLALLIATSPAFAQDINEASFVPKATAALDAILKLKVERPHHFLHDVSRDLPQALLGQDWEAVHEFAKERSLTVVERSRTHSQFVLQPKAFTYPSGQAVDLRLLLLSDSSFPASVRKPKLAVGEANVALVATLDASYARIVADKRFPPGSVLEAVLQDQKVREAGEEWPLVHKIAVHYDVYIDKWSPANRSVFHIVVEFAANADEEIGGKKVYLHLASGLDPLRTATGKIPRGFVPQDTLAEPWSSGGNEWWHGTPDVVKANQQQYLRKKP